jgi:predicted Zn-dependent peptidase
VTSVVTETLLGADQGGLVRRSVLPGGLRVITEAMPTVRSASFGIWVGVGSVDETPAQAGATHYLEHLLFKGTPSRTALEISSSIEAVGGELNAFTSKEYTCYHARVLDEDLPLAIKVLSDMVTSSLIKADDVDAERDVVLDEIAMRDDEPADAVHELAVTRLWGDAPLGRPVIGSVESITAMTRDLLADYYADRYRPENVVIAAAGNLDHDVVVHQVLEAFGDFLSGDAEPTSPRVGGAVPASGHGVALLERPTEQANVVVARPGMARTDERRFALSVLDAALGGGMSSRLFQEIREKRGLTYSVYSFAAQHAPTGLVGVYAGCQPKKIDEVLGLIRSVLDDVATSGITDDELARGKGQARGGIVLGLEDTSARMSRIAKSELVYDELLSVDELIARVDAVAMDDVRTIAHEFFSGTPALAIVGPFDDPSRFDAS